MKKIISSLLIVSIIITIPIQSYAFPGIKRSFNIGRSIGKWLGKKSLDAEKEYNKNLVKDHKEKEIKKTKNVLKKHEGLLSDKDIKDIKTVVDDMLKSPKENKGSRKQILNGLEKRLENKKLIYEDHERIRESIKRRAATNFYFEGTPQNGVFLGSVPVGPVPTVVPGPVPLLAP